MEKIKNKNGIKYREKIMIDGVVYSSPRFSRKTDAKSWKSKMISDREKSSILGHQFAVQKRKKFREFAENWLENKVKVQRTASTFNNYDRTLRIHFFPVIGHLYLDQITSNYADQIVKKLLESGHNVNGTNKIIQVLKTVLSEAEKTDSVRKNPLKFYKCLKVPKRPPTFWSSFQINQFLKANANNPLYPLFVIALNTGMRKGEIAGLCWDRVDFDRNLITVSRIRDRYGLRETTKTGIVRFVPMNGIVRDTLLKLFKQAKNDFVFTKSDGSLVAVQHLYRDFKKAQEVAEISQHIRFHDLRHCFASHFMMNNGNVFDLQKILGHSQVEMTQLYAHLSPDHLAGTTQIISFS